jgi:hypothetical protein
MLKRFNISRFNKKHIGKLKDILAKLENNKGKYELKKELNLTQNELKTLNYNLQQTIFHIDNLYKKYGNNIWFY